MFKYYTSVFFKFLPPPLYFAQLILEHIVHILILFRGLFLTLFIQITKSFGNKKKTRYLKTWDAHLTFVCTYIQNKSDMHYKGGRYQCFCIDTTSSFAKLNLWLILYKGLLPSSAQFQLSEVEAVMVFIVAISNHLPNRPPTPGKYQNGLGQLIIGKESCYSIWVHTKNNFDPSYWP